MIIAMRQGLHHNVCMFVISLAAWIVEAVLLRHSGQSGYSFIFFVLPTVYFLFRIILGCHIMIKDSKRLADVSVYIYCVHPALILFFKSLFPINAIALFFCVIIASIVLSISCSQFKQLCLCHKYR